MPISEQLELSQPATGSETANANVAVGSGQMKIAVLIPDGVGVRNFVLGRLLRLLPQATEADVFHIVPDELLPRASVGLNGQVHWHPLKPYRPNRFVLTLQYSLSYAQMYWADTVSMRRIRNAKVPGTWRIRTLHKMAKGIGRACSSPSRMKLLEGLHNFGVEKLPEFDWYTQQFKQCRPSVLFSSNQRPSVVVPAILAARKLGIPTATFIFSWDNLTSKGRITAPFDHYLVWSQHMASELRRYYPHVTDDRIHVVGTPQFEPYAEPRLLWSREQFFKRIGADPARPLICYSGGDAGTCPEDAEHVRVLMELIRAGRIQGNPQVIVRPVPVDNGKRYEHVRQLFPELIYAQPKWVHADPKDWAQVIPLPEDVQFLANLTHHTDLNVNLGSTMTLDFGLHDKPVVNIAFDVANPPIFGMPVWDYYYFFEHYRPVVELGASRPARSPEELASYVNAYLADPSLDREGRKKLADMQVGVPLGDASSLILQALRKIATTKPASQFKQ